MPIYSFHCKCGHIFEELFLSVKEYEESDKKLICPKCNLFEERNRVIGDVVSKFSGSGWTERRKSNSTSSLRDTSVEIKDEIKNTKSSEVYNTTMPKDKG